MTRVFILFNSFQPGRRMPTEKVNYISEIRFPHPPSDLQFVLAYVGREKKRLILGLLTMALGLTVYMQIPLYLQKAVDLIAAKQNLSPLWSIAGMILLLTFLQGIARFFARVWVVSASRRFEYQIRQDLWAHLLHRPQSFHDQMYTGDLMARLTNDLNAIRMAFGPALMYAAYAVVSMIWAIGYMLHIHVRLTLAVVGPMTLVIGLVFIITRIIRKRFEIVQAGFSELSRVAQETFTGIRDVKAYVVENQRHRVFSQVADKYVEGQKKLSRAHSIIRPTITLITGFGLLALLAYGGKLVSRGILSLGTFVAFNAYLGMLIWPLMSIGWIANLWQRGLASLHRITTLLDFSTYPHPDDASRTIPPAATTDPATPFIPTLDVENVTFGYPRSKKPVLKDIQLHIPAGQWLALVGPAGSGKSTLLKLLVGLYDPTQGSIRWGHRPLHEWPLTFFRQSVVLVTQEPLLFSKTIRENLLLGLTDSPPSDREIMEAVRAAGFLPDLEMMPRGLDTLIGERGVNLSGGQKQRLALARALLRKPAAILLDDPFAQVDVETERFMWQALRQYLPPSTTVILVTQRILATLQCDAVAVLEHGNLVALGPPETLRNVPGWYATAVHLQEQLLRKMPGYHNHVRGTS